MKSQIRFGALALLAAGALLAPRAASAQCNLASFAGTFKYTYTGTADGIGSVTVTGTMITDGAGNFTDTHSATQTTVITKATNPFTMTGLPLLTIEVPITVPIALGSTTDTGTYYVNFDCTGSMNYHYDLLSPAAPAGNPPLTQQLVWYDFVLANSLKTFYAVSDQIKDLSIGTGTKQ